MLLFCPLYFSLRLLTFLYTLVPLSFPFLMFIYTEDPFVPLTSLLCFAFYKKRQWQDLNLRLHRRSDFESHALDHSATLSSCTTAAFFLTFKMQVVGFDPTPPERPVPETSALDHSATLAVTYIQDMETIYNNNDTMKMDI